MQKEMMLCPNLRIPEGICEGHTGRLKAELIVAVAKRVTLPINRAKAEDKWDLNLSLTLLPTLQGPSLQAEDCKVIDAEE